MCNIIIYLAVDKDGTEWVFGEEPQQMRIIWRAGTDTIQLPRGTIKKLTGKDITWESGYIEYVGVDYDPTNE